MEWLRHDLDCKAGLEEGGSGSEARCGGRRRLRKERKLAGALSAPVGEEGEGHSLGDGAQLRW